MNETRSLLGCVRARLRHVIEYLAADFDIHVDSLDPLGGGGGSTGPELPGLSWRSCVRHEMVRGWDHGGPGRARDVALARATDKLLRSTDPARMRWP